MLSSAQTVLHVIPILLAFAGYIAAECSLGCLKCSPDGICLLCDYPLLYINDAGKCVKAQIPNCTAIDSQGNCITCSAKTFLINGACVELPIANLITGCKEYLSASACKTCDADSYLDSGKCLKAKAYIPNCAVHISSGEYCTTCKKGTLLNPDQKSCVTPVLKDNCLSYSLVGCGACKPGFYLSPQKYEIEAAKISGLSDKANLRTLARFIDQVRSQSRETFELNCVPTTAANCIEFEDFDTCSKCSAGYFLTSEGKCQLFPRDPVINCETYSDFATCSRCANKFYMANANECAAVSEIRNCANYSRDSDGVCLQCTPDYYTDQSSCILRVKSKGMSNCAVLDAVTDTCAQCAEGFEVNSDGTVCLTALPFCIGYTKNATALTCITCQSSYYLDNGVCLKSNAQNCRASTGLATCSECANGYFLNGTACSPHPLMTALNCNVTKSTGINECSACAPTRVKISMDGMCLPVTTPINNCYRYTSATQCATCNPKTSYLKDDLCRGAFISNCSEYLPNLENACKTCRADYTVGTVYIPFPKGVANNACVPGDPNIIQNCMVYQPRDDAEYCATCNSKYYPFIMPTANMYYCVPKSFYKLPKQDSLLLDCQIFNPKTGRCIQCAGTKVVGSDGVCTLQCKSDEFLYAYSYDETVAADARFKSMMECSATDPTLSQSVFYALPLPCYMVIESYTETENICGACRSTEIGAIDLTKDLTKTIMLSYFQLPNQVSFSYYNRVAPVHNCLPRQVTYNGQTTTTETRVVYVEGTTMANLDNCRLVSKIGTSDRYGCVACRFGFSGLIVADADANGYIIKKCEAIPSCVATTYYNGLGSRPNQLTSTTPALDFFVSCHVCSDQKIPTFARAFSAALTDVVPNIKQGFFGAFGVPAADDTVPPYQKTTKNGWLTSCQTPGMGKTFVANCAVQELALSRVLQNYASNSATNNPLCLACSPGFLATLQAADSRIISACTKITNCDVTRSNTFNKCGACVKGFSLKYDTTGTDGISKYEECVASPNGDDNCFVANSATNVCMVCKAGYIINADGICDAINAYACQAPSIFQKLGKKSMKSLGFPLSGCARCQSNAISVLFDTPKQVCLLSSQLFSGTSPAVSRLIITNCVLFVFDNSNNVICQTCDTGYVISFSATKCHKATNNLKNCVVYSDDGLSCSKCANGFYLNSLYYCVQGAISHCAVYGGEKRCETCEEGYLAIQAEGSRVLCIAQPQVQCQIFETGALASGMLSCNLCNYNYYYEKTVAVVGKLPLTYCAGVPEVPNCAAYENQSDILSAKLMCRTCVDGYYLNGGSCLTRTRPSIPNCDVLANTKDACDVCKSGFLVDEQGACASFPDGIAGCLLYKNNKLCQQCRSGMFLSQNRCLAVPKDSLVINCEVYDESMRCTKCVNNFYLTNSTRCDEAKATNCLTYYSLSVCSTCPPNYGIVRDKETTSCVKMSISNCLQPDYSVEGPNFKCKVCVTSFYLASDKSCVAVTKLIDHCALYASNTECSMCFEGYVLSQDRKACTNNPNVLQFFDPNCLNNFVQTSPVCNMCNQKFHFERNGTSGYMCSACDEVVGAGCLMCDPSNTAKCLACGTGYSQKVDGSCEVTEPPPPQIVDSRARIAMATLVAVIACLFSVY